ncbi:hypothetical protein BH11CYA1_BH11CYA1_13040 [soil metagenome]
MVAVCLAHFYLAHLLDWKNDMKTLKPINQQVFFAHTMFLTIGMAMLGLVCIFCPHELINKSTLGAISALCFALCWLSRLIFQFVVFTSAFAEDTRLEKVLRLAGTLLWLFLTLLFSLLFAYQIGCYEF